VLYLTSVCNAEQVLDKSVDEEVTELVFVDFTVCLLLFAWREFVQIATHFVVKEAHDRDFSAPGSRSTQTMLVSILFGQFLNDAVS